jgi:hypothetical protein
MYYACTYLGSSAWRGQVSGRGTHGSRLTVDDMVWYLTLFVKLGRKQTASGECDMMRSSDSERVSS